MANIDYRHLIGGEGRGQGLPVRRGSHLYDVEPRERYPNVLNAGVSQGHQKQWGKAKYHIAPHLTILSQIEPYISNHVAGGTFTRKQYYVLKQGQAVMATYKNEPTIGVFGASDGDGKDADLKYADVGDLATNGIVVGFVPLSDTWYMDLSQDPADVVKTNTKPGASYTEVTETDPLPIEQFGALTNEEKEGWVAAYDQDDLEDMNDEIVTGGENMYAATGAALFGSTEAEKFIKIDAEGYYFGQVLECDGFMFPATGGANRVMFYNNVDAEAEVTLPVEDSSSIQSAPFVVPIEATGLTTLPQTGNQSSWAESASYIEYQPTVGVAHKEFEQSHSHIYHHFQTGTPATGPKQVQKAGELNIPFVDVAKLEAFVASNIPQLTYGASGPSGFNFTDSAGDLSGLKTGVFDDGTTAPTLDDELLASYFTDKDSGYANLYYNFAAPFLTFRGDENRFGSRAKIKPDLFGMYTTADAGFFASGVTGPTRGGISFTTSLEAANKNGEVDMRALGLEDEVIGSVTRIVDIPENSLESLRINKIWQSRFVGDKSRNWTNEGYRRLGGTADTAGLRPVLADFALMLLGGSAYQWASGRLVDYRNMRHDVSNVLRDMVRERVIGVAEIYFDAV